MVIRRGQVWWTDLGVPRGASPGFQRPAIVVQANGFNRTDIDSVIVAISTTNLRLARMPGNVPISPGVGGLREDSVINITQLFTVDKNDLIELLGSVPNTLMEQIDEGLRLVLSLPGRE